jgi:hypothetical protein
MSTWGVAKPLPLPAVYIPANDVTCNSSTATTAITTGALSALDNGNYYPLILGVITILLGGTAPSALTIKFILGAGSAVDTYTVEPALLVNSAELVIPIALIGANSATSWSGSGSTINVQITATGQAVTCKKVGSRLIVALFCGPDT